MIKAIIFDCFGVLNEARWPREVSRLTSDIQSKVRDVHSAYQRGFINYQDFKSQVGQVAGLEQAVIDDIFVFGRTYQKNIDLLRLIKQLRSSYKIGILSNVGSGWVRDEFLKPQEVGLFDDMVLSFEVGLAKPDQEIFQLACKRLGVMPKNALFVDDYDEYCRAAKDVGMQAILYKDFIQFKQQLQELLTNTND